MTTPPIQDDVFDPTADPRHKPPVAAPGEQPDVSKPRGVTEDAPPPPDEPAITPVKPVDRPA
jgi:hypothetical protein